MHTLPDNVHEYKRTRVFTDTSVPAALTNDHNTRAGVWGRIEIHTGSLRYHILEGPAAGSTTLSPEVPGIVAPQERHRVEVIGPVTFQVVFLRPEERPSSNPSAHELSGL